MMILNKLHRLSLEARLSIAEKCNQIGGIHIGGSYSSIDFLVAYYLTIYNQLDESDKLNFYEGKMPFHTSLLISKGHCYVAQLAALDAVFGKSKYLDQYFLNGSEYFGHPKLNKNNFHFPASTGSLGQGIVYGNGLSLGFKIKDINDHRIVSLVGDGEMQEGVTYEALNFLSQHSLNHWVILDNNNQISLGRSSDILNIGHSSERLVGLNIDTIQIDGHDPKKIYKLSQEITSSHSSAVRGCFVELNTIKGQGVSFMEGAIKWHHRRFRDGEYEAARNELRGKLDLA